MRQEDFHTVQNRLARKFVDALLKWPWWMFPITIPLMLLWLVLSIIFIFFD